MANQRTTFGKRQREQNRKDRNAAKVERLAKARAEARTQRESQPTIGVDASTTDGQPPVAASNGTPVATPSTPATPSAPVPSPAPSSTTRKRP